MKVESVGEIIAERKFTLLRDGHSDETIPVLLGKPQHIPQHTDFYCLSQSRRSLSEKIRGIWELDAFQALQLASSMIGVGLEVIRKEGQLICDGNDQGDLGFPVPDRKKE